MPRGFSDIGSSATCGTDSRSGYLEVTAIRDRSRRPNSEARLLIGADGARSKVARQIRGTRPNGNRCRLRSARGLRAEPAARPRRSLPRRPSAPGWFGWTIPSATVPSRIGTGSANGVKPLESFRATAVGFPTTFGTARVRTHSAGAIALWEPTAMVADRVMLVGDAARQVKPTSGGGSTRALDAAAFGCWSCHRRFRGLALGPRARVHTSEHGIAGWAVNCDANTTCGAPPEPRRDQAPLSHGSAERETFAAKSSQSRISTSPPRFLRRLAFGIRSSPHDSLHRPQFRRRGSVDRWGSPRRSRFYNDEQ